MGAWSPEDIPWDQFDRSRIDPEIVPIVKAASMVEANALDYLTYLRNVFHDDDRIKKAVEGWAKEEVQHGEVLGRWAAMADPEFDYDACLTRFTEGFRLPLEAEESVRGSRAGELVARCIVETGTHTYYSALRDTVDEPVLKAICGRIADDENAHYRMFHRHLNRYIAAERLSRWQRVRVALGRIAEAEDDELAYAYYAANGGDRPYDRNLSGAAYARGAIACYHHRHVARAVSMTVNALGLSLNGWVARQIAWLVLPLLRWRGRRKARRAALAPAEGPSPIS